MIRVAVPAALIAAALMSPLPAVAQQSIQIEQAWSRAAMAGRNGAVFLTVTAVGQPDRLTGASTPAAEKTELHESIMDAGVMKMREVQGLPVAPGTPAVLAPGGYHFMLVHLKQPLNEGDRIPVTLTFEKAGAIQTTALVAKAGAPMPGMAHQHK